MIFFAPKTESSMVTATKENQFDFQELEQYLIGIGFGWLVMIFEHSRMMLQSIKTWTKLFITQIADVIVMFIFMYIVQFPTFIA